MDSSHRRQRIKIDGAHRMEHCDGFCEYFPRYSFVFRQTGFKRLTIEGRIFENIQHCI